MLFVGAMRAGLGFVYVEPNGYHPHRPVRGVKWLYGRATLPAPFCFRGPRSSAGCIAPTKSPPWIFRLLTIFRLQPPVSVAQRHQNQDRSYQQMLLDLSEAVAKIFAQGLGA
jgi:hypothetical protein